MSSVTCQLILNESQESCKELSHRFQFPKSEYPSAVVRLNAVITSWHGLDIWETINWESFLPVKWDLNCKSCKRAWFGFAFSRDLQRLEQQWTVATWWFIRTTNRFKNTVRLVHCQSADIGKGFESKPSGKPYYVALKSKPWDDVSFERQCGSSRAHIDSGRNLADNQLTHASFDEFDGPNDLQLYVIWHEPI